VDILVKFLNLSGTYMQSFCSYLRPNFKVFTLSMNLIPKFLNLLGT